VHKVVANSQTVVAEFGKARAIGRWQCPHDEIDCVERWKYVYPYDFPDPPFHAISFHSRMGMTRHDYSSSGVTCEGCDMSDLKMRGSKSLSP
jgi:hypothetical protein